MMRSFTRFLTVAFACTIAVSRIASATEADAAAGDTSAVETTAPSTRLLGVMPNYMTVDSGHVTVQTTHDAYKAASLNTFDPFVYPTVGVLTMFGSGSGSSYAARYSRAFADNAIGNFMTSAVVPSLTGEDSRYYRRGTGGVLSRLAYAASRSVVTRTRSGGTAFNISEIGGNAAAAALSNLYYSPSDRTVGATAMRGATQIAWDTLANELKEFWPDINAKIRRR
jgi:hypothetical protein